MSQVAGEKLIYFIQITPEKEFTVTYKAFIHSAIWSYMQLKCGNVFPVSKPSNLLFCFPSHRQLRSEDQRRNGILQAQSRRLSCDQISIPANQKCWTREDS